MIIKQPRQFLLHAILLFMLAVLIQVVSFKAIYLSIFAGIILSTYCVLRCNFMVFPVLIVLYARSSSVLFWILTLATIYILVMAIKRKMDRILGFPDILIFPLLILIGSMTIAACNRSGYYWNESHYHELWSVFGLFSFYFGMLLNRTVSLHGLQLLLPVGIFIFLVELTFRQDEDSRSYARQIFYWGPFFVALFFYQIKKTNLVNLGCSLIGVVLFVATMIVGLPTLTLQGSAFYAVGVVMFAPYKNVFAKLGGYIFASWPVFIIVILTMIYGVLSLENQSVARDRVQSEIHQYSFVSLDADFLRKFRAKMFDDRAVLWRAVWDDANREPYFWHPTDERYIRGFEDSLGNYFAIYEIPPHNIYVGALFRMRWIAGIIFLILYCTMIVRAGKLLFVKSVDGIWIVISGTTVVVGVFGGLTGDFPMTFTFNFPFMALAGLCYAQYLDCTKRVPLVCS